MAIRGRSDPGTPIFGRAESEASSDEEYIRALRAKLARTYPGTTFYFLPTDIVNQILNFGLPAPLDIQVIGENMETDHAVAESMLCQIALYSGRS